MDGIYFFIQNTVIINHDYNILGNMSTISIGQKWWPTLMINIT